MEKEERKTDNSFGVVSFICGLFSVLLSITIAPAIVLGVLGIIFGIMQKKRSKNKWTVWGIVLSAIGIILAILIIIWIVSWVNQLTTLLQTCQANPSAPGCEEFLKLTQGQANGYYPQ